ncbi:flagellar hook-associated protein FlgK [Geomonas sp. RF6]|uniref:flagellar hook-associated protein FlgK n=1 Tax=Geomonas sp. RF6 TaxID=2897342 RepID=UPI001E3DC03C|nr:flagellar hook-associated protein FlgK [Geomonas sp. RF6]UFS72409.1 flagellar hook-associated protein FlgK [Geomonas sp. RF6]
MGIGDIYRVGYAGMAAARTAMEVTGENISNVNTEGYSKQQVNLATRFSIAPSGIDIGTGVEVTAVYRSYDNMLQQQLVNGKSTYQQNLTRQNALTQIQPSFNELNSNGLGASLTSFFQAWQDLSANAQGSAERQALLSKSQILVDNFHNVAKSLTGVATVADQSLVGISSEVTDNAKNIAVLNAQIISTVAAGGTPNTLYDQRDLLLQQMAEKVGISSTIQTDGTVTVALSGGQQIVSGNKYATLYAQQNAAVPPTNDLYVTAIGAPPPSNNPLADTNVTATVGGANNSMGKIGGTLQVRDSIVPGYMAKLDEMASSLVSSVNTAHAAGFDVNGNTGINFFNPAGTTAATISLAAGLTGNRIAAADTNPTLAGGGVANNVNARAIAGIADTTYAFSTGSDTFAGFYETQVSQVGIDVQSAQNATNNGEGFLKQLGVLRSSVSGVSLDEELTNLMQYQQAFQGAAKIVNTWSEMVDTLLGMVR